MENVKPWQVLNCKESRDQLKKVNPDKVWPHLLGCKVVEKEDVIELAQKQSRESQMDKLLKLISQKGLKTYNKFVEYLEKNDHGRIANYLLKEGKLVLALLSLHFVRLCLRHNECMLIQELDM